MKHQHWLAIAAATAIALTGCMHKSEGSRDTDQSSSSSSGTMRRAESGSNTTPNPDTRNTDCLPGDARTNCPPETGQPSTTPSPVPEPESGATAPR
jgi:hypothetical protein